MGILGATVSSWTNRQGAAAGHRAELDGVLSLENEVQSRLVQVEERLDRASMEAGAYASKHSELEGTLINAQSTVRDALHTCQAGSAQQQEWLRWVQGPGLVTCQNTASELVAQLERGQFPLSLLWLGGQLGVRGGLEGVAGVQTAYSEALSSCLQASLQVMRLLMEYREGVTGGGGGMGVGGRGVETWGRAKEWAEAFQELLSNSSASNVDAVRERLERSGEDAVSGWMAINGEGEAIRREIEAAGPTSEQRRGDMEEARRSMDASLHHWKDRRGVRGGEAATLMLARCYVAIHDVRIPGEMGDHGLGEGVWALAKLTHRVWCCGREGGWAGAEALPRAEDFLGKISEIMGDFSRGVVRDAETLLLTGGNPYAQYIGGFRQLAMGVRNDIALHHSNLKPQSSAPNTQYSNPQTLKHSNVGVVNLKTPTFFREALNQKPKKSKPQTLNSR